MKRFLYTVLVLSALVEIKSQIVFCPPGAEWHYNFQDGPAWWNIIHNEKAKYARDSVLGSETVKVINHQHFSHDCSFYLPFTLIKQSGDTVFIRNARTFNKWQILYNFAATTGQSWQDSLKGLYPGQIIVYSTTVTTVGSDVSNGFTLKKLYVSTSYTASGENPSSPYSYAITERYGSDIFLFPFKYSKGCEAGMFNSFLCYEDNTFGLKQFSSRSCDHTAGLDVSTFEGSEEIKIYPNPALDIVQIELDNSTNPTLTLFDVSGREVLIQTLNKTISEIDLHELPPGIYFLQISNDQKIISTQKFIKQ